MPKPNWREASPLERSAWQKWVDFYTEKVTPAVVGFQLAAGFAADTQTWLSNRGLSISTGPVFTSTDLANVQGTLQVYNALGRIMLGVHSSKYGIDLYKGDIDVKAPPDMPAEEFQQDRLGLVIIPIIIYAIAMGAVVVAGIWGWSNGVKHQADRDFTKYKNNLLTADKEMMKQPPAVRNDWIKHRKEMIKQEADSKKDTGWLVKIFGSKIGGGIAAGGVILLALLALRFIPRGKK